MYELSRATLHHIAGGFDEMRASLGVLTSTVGYVTARTQEPFISESSTTGVAASIIGCGSIAHLIASNPRFSAGAATVAGMTTGFLCAATARLGKIIYDEIVRPPGVLDDNGLYL